MQMSVREPSATTPIPAGDAHPLLLARSLKERAGELVALLTEIATVDSARAEVEASIRVLRNASVEFARTRPARGGRVCVFLPSNNVLYSYVLFGLMPSLFAGEVRIRPSARIRETALRIHRLLCDLPLSPVRMLDVTQKDFLADCREASAVVFSGRYENLRRVSAALPDDVPVLGFGSGPNPVVVGPEADLPRVVEDVVRARLFNGGQDCLCPDLVIVHRSLAAEARHRFAQRLAAVPRGSRKQAGLVAPPLYYDDAFAAAQGFLRENQEYVVGGGSSDPAARWLEPTLVEIPDLAQAHPPELFSPILCMTTYERPEEALEWLTAPEELSRGMYVSVYGEPALTGAILGTSVNCGPRSALDAEDGNSPFGGYGERASARWLGGRATARPLLLSAELAAAAVSGTDAR